MKDSDELDFLFINAGITLSPSGGFEITYKLASALTDKGYNVGILFIRDIFRILSHIYPDESLKNYVRKNLAYSVFSNIVNHRIGIIPLILMRKFLKINYKEEFNGIRLFFSNGEKPMHAQYLIANGWHTSLVMSEWKTNGNKYIFLQQDDADERWNPSLSSIAHKALTSGIPIISTNSSVTNKYKNYVVGQIPLSINNNFFKCYIPPEKRDDKNILLPLRRQAYKGARLGLEIISSIHKEDPTITIHSFGDLPQSTVPEYVHHHGIVNSERLLELYNQVSIFILPSLVEGYGLTALEAMACGAALVTTDNEGIREFVKNGINGIVSKQFDPLEIEGLVEELLSNKQYRYKLAQEGIKTGVRHNLDFMVNSFLEMF